VEAKEAQAIHYTFLRFTDTNSELAESVAAFGALVEGLPGGSAADCQACVWGLQSLKAMMARLAT
jgi:hypothetical protein